MADKGRATINGTVGEYHFNCPLDNMLFSFKGVQAEAVKSLLASGATDEQVAAWLDQNGIPKTADEIKVWSDSVEAIQPYQDPEDRDWFASECAKERRRAQQLGRHKVSTGVSGRSEKQRSGPGR